MPSLKDLRNRITSVKSTQKITRAMQMVSAAKLRRAQESAEQARPYSDRMASMLASVTANLPSLDGAPALMVRSGDDQVHLLVVMTAERGLCGSFNSSVVRAARRRMAELREAGKTVKFLCVGKKGHDNLKRDLEESIVEFISLREVRNPGFDDAHAVASRLVALFEAGEYDVCTIFFNAFKSVMTQVMTVRQLIPLIEAAGEAGVEQVEEPERPDLAGAVHEFEPEESELLAELVPRNLSVQIFKALLESSAAEQAARMTAMDNATRNAGEMIDKLTLNYNRTRQAAITRELIEIVSGAEAL